MPRPTKPTLSGAKFHYIPEWAEKRDLKQAEVARELDVDKGTVSRWFKGNIPTEKHLLALAGLFSCTVPDLFRHPDDDWLSRFLRGRSEEERERIIETLKTAFPKVA